MPRYLIKLPTGKYLEWSTVTDSPVSEAMTRDELEAWHLRMFGEREHANFPDRMARVDATGCSGRDMTLDECIAGNRAGDNDTELTLDQIVAAYG